MQPTPGAAPGDPLASARAWFAAQGWAPFPFQDEVWQAFAARFRASSTLHRHGQDLCCGTAAARDRGRSGTADTAPLRWHSSGSRLLARAGRGHRPRAPPRRTRPGILTGPIDVRTGDTGAVAARARQRNRLPDRAGHHAGEPHAPARPRRLARALRAPDDRRRRRVARAHGQRSAACRPSSRSRGCAARARSLSHMGALGDPRQLSMPRSLASSAPPRPKPARIVRGRRRRRRSRSTAPLRQTIERFPWAGHIGLQLLPQVVARDRRRASPHSCSPTSRSADRDLVSGDSRGAARLGRHASRCITARSSARCATGSRKACAPSG